VIGSLTVTVPIVLPNSKTSGGGLNWELTEEVEPRIAREDSANAESAQDIGGFAINCDAAQNAPTAILELRAS
jgi:hypothetical protein